MAIILTCKKLKETFYSVILIVVLTLKIGDENFVQSFWGLNKQIFVGPNILWTKIP